MQYLGKQHGCCLPKFARVGLEQLGEVHHSMLSKMTATVARMSLVTALQQANVRAPYTSPEKLGLMSPEKLGLTQDAPSAQNQDGERPECARCDVRGA